MQYMCSTSHPAPSSCACCRCHVCVHRFYLQYQYTWKYLIVLGMPEKWCCLMAITVKRIEKLKSYSPFHNAFPPPPILRCMLNYSLCHNAVKHLFRGVRLDSPDCCVSVNSSFCIALTCTQDSVLSPLDPIVTLRGKTKKFPKELRLLKYFVDSSDHHDDRWIWCKNDILCSVFRGGRYNSSVRKEFVWKNNIVIKLWKLMGKGLKILFTIVECLPD
jgi:hypothetical protein